MTIASARKYLKEDKIGEICIELNNGLIRVRTKKAKKLISRNVNSNLNKEPKVFKKLFDLKKGINRFQSDEVLQIVEKYVS